MVFDEKIIDFLIGYFNLYMTVDSLNCSKSTLLLYIFRIGVGKVQNLRHIALYIQASRLQ